MNKMGKDDVNKTQKLYRCGSNYALSKLIVNNGLYDLLRRKNPDSSEFTIYNRFSGTRSRIGRLYADIKIPNDNKINHIMVSFTDHYNAISLYRLFSETEI